ncbi:MAG: hypothetical protein LQ345_000999 [Seirophora villosa]|nr:MAG: hypothetical protein LQ345_000999 [Seirophora villosa]
MSGEVSHGRGGAGNIKPDDTPYTDGSIVREGPVGDQGNGAYSVGRGGAGNIDSPRVKPSNPDGKAGDTDVIPEPALREPGPGYENYHTGRGGEGNVHKENHSTGTEEHGGLGEKIKHKILGKKD